MPTEKKYSYWSHDCHFPDTINCPYDHPYLDQHFKQITNFATRNNVNKYCESTKICCQSAPENTLPHNKYKLQEILKQMQDSKSIKDKQIAIQIQNILEPPTITKNPNEKTVSRIYYILPLLFTVTFAILGLQFCWMV